MAWDDINNLWWLKPRDTSDIGQQALSGLQLGAQMRHQRVLEDLEAKQQQIHAQQVGAQAITQMSKMIDDAAASKGMAELSSHLATVAERGAWDEPWAEAGYWDILQRNPKLGINANADKIYDNTFGASKRYKEKAAGALPAGAVINIPGGGRLVGTGGAAHFVPAEKTVPTQLQKLMDLRDELRGMGFDEDADLAQAAAESLSTKLGMRMTTDREGNVTFEQVPIKGGAPPGELTAGFKGRLQEQAHNYDNAMELLSHVESSITAGDVGLRGVGKELWSRIGGQLGVEVNPEQMDVRKSIQLLRATLYKSLRSDSNITEAERKQIENMLPSTGAFESLSDARAALNAVRRELENRTRKASSLMKTPLPIWTLTPEEMGAEYQAGRITAKELMNAIQKYYPDWKPPVAAPRP
jgi:hypothetical protein